MKPEELHLLTAPSDPRISPDGTTTAFVSSTPNLDGDRYDKTIWLAGEAVRQLTAGPGDTNPRWSPDGDHIAFLRSLEDEKPQVSVIPVGGGEASILTDFEFGAESVEWSPDGSKLVAVGITSTDEWANLDDEERDRRPRRVTKVPYRSDHQGWTHDRKRHLWMVDPVGLNDATCLTPGEFDESTPAWAPDGKGIVFLTDRDPNRGLTSGNDLFELDLASGKTTRAAPRGFWQIASYRHDGVLHLLGNESPRYPVNAYVYRREQDGSLTNLTGHLDRSSVGLAAGPARMEWRGPDVVTAFEDAGAVGVIAVEPSGEVEHLVSGQQVVTGFDVASSGVVHTSSRLSSPGELYLNDTKLTSFHTGEPNWVQPIQIRVGLVDAWIYLPDGEESVPLLLNIHGGPASQYGVGFHDEFQVYVEAGYGVVAANPRGSSGRGEEWVEAVKGEAWGEVDLEDINAVVSAALEQFPRLDESRMGIMGGSYGGFMTAWMIGKQDRWKSAVVERALVSWTSFAGTSDIGGVFPENYTNVGYPEGWERWWKLSPLAFAENVTTPTLIIHSEEDWRCPIEQAEQYFMALLRNGTTSEFVRFPGEGHEMSRSGKPRHRQERFEAILDWHARHLT